MRIERHAGNEFMLAFDRSDEIGDPEAGGLLVPHPVLRAWIKANAASTSTMKGSRSCTVWMTFDIDRIDDAERFFTLLRVVGILALETA